MIEVKQHHAELNSAVIDNIHINIKAQLERFDNVIRRVCMQIADINGPRGGEDMTCRIQVYRKKAASIVAEDCGENLMAVVRRAVAKAHEALSRSKDRLIEKRYRNSGSKD